MSLRNVVLGVVLGFSVLLAYLHLAGGRIIMPYKLFYFQGSYKEKEVFQWTAEFLRVKPVNMPRVYWISSEELKSEFVKRKGSILHNQMLIMMLNGISKERIYAYISLIIENVVAFYDHRTEEIFITESLLEGPPCKMQSILAHEFTHHFQNKYDNLVDLDIPEADEIQAEMVEKAYLIFNKCL